MLNEYKNLINEIRKLPKEERPDWYKYLDNQNRKERRRKSSQYKFEQLLDPNTFDYKDFEGV